MFEEYQLTELTAIPVIIGLVQMFKESGFPSRYCPLLALFLGIGAGLIIGGLSVQSGVSGMILGLAASGVYRGQKVLVRQDEEVI